MTRKLNLKNLDKIRHDLNKLDWPTKLSEFSNVNKSFEYVHDIILKKLDAYAPERTVLRKPLKHSEPWVTSGIKNSLRKQRLLYKKINTCHVTTCNRDFYKQYRNSLQRVLRTSKKTYYSQQCVDFKSNTKKLWGIINKVVNKSSHKQNIIDKLKIGNVTSGNASDIVEEFSKYYANIERIWPVR